MSHFPVIITLLIIICLSSSPFSSLPLNYIVLVNMGIWFYVSDKNLEFVVSTRLNLLNLCHEHKSIYILNILSLCVFILFFLLGSRLVRLKHIPILLSIYSSPCFHLCTKHHLIHITPINNHHKWYTNPCTYHDK